MNKRTRRPARTVPETLAELTLASWETIARRSWMIATGACSPAECGRMMLEKARAVEESSRALGSGDLAAIFAPWHGRATANAKRLRRAHRRRRRS
jgi:hypothetical protein